MSDMELVYTLLMKWSSQKFEIVVNSDDCVGDLKLLIWSLTTVPPERQKILGLVKGKLPSDEVEINSLGLKLAESKEFMMIGTAEGLELQPPTGPTIFAEEEEDYSVRESRLAGEKAKNNARNQRKLREATKELKIDLMNAPREGKKLLVLDLDYCILDTKLWQQENFVTEHFARPYLHELLNAVSPYYDIIFWSQTSWRWLEEKLFQLQIIGSETNHYHVVTTLNKSCMFSVYSTRDNKPFKHEVKALQIIWNKFPLNYNSKNTIHIDDLGRNFLLNEPNGLKVKAYKDAMNNRDTDRELVYITKYLLQLVKIDDFTTMDQSKYKEFEGELPEGIEDPVSKMGLKVKKRKAVEEVQGESSAGPSSSTGGGAKE